MLVSERSPDFAASLKLLSEAIGANNGDERFRPAMVAVYMDRLAYRLQEYETSLEWLDRLYWVVDGVPFDKRSAALRMQVIPQYFQQLKREQQDILVLANTTNETIRNAPQTLVDMRLSLSRYEALLASARRVLEDSGDQVQRSMEDRLLWKRGWEKELAATIKQLRASLDQYESDLPRLKRKVEWFEFSQSGMPPQWVVVGAVLIAGGLVGFLVWRRRRGPTDRSENGTAA
jgi:hypothetical protein